MSNIAFSLATGIVATAARYLGKSPKPEPPQTLRRRVELLLADRGGSGFAMPRTTWAARDELAHSIRLATAGAPSLARAVATYAGLRPVVATLPDDAPVAIAGTALLYRDGPDADGLILATACARLLLSAGIPAVDADSWLLASEVAAPANVFG